MASRNPQTFRIELQKKGQLTLPAEIRKGLPEHVSFEIRVLQSGKLLLDPLETRSIADKWFQTEAWQSKHARSVADVAAGRVTGTSLADAVAKLEKRLAG